MALRSTPEGVGTESPRWKDCPQNPGRPPTADRDSNGRFVAGTRAGIGNGIRSLIRKGLGDPSDPQTGPLVKEALRVYHALIRTLPDDCPGVRVLVAAQARNTVLAAHLANEALRVGVATKQGLELSEASRQHDTTAQRLGVTAYDRAVREAKVKPSKVKKPWELIADGTYQLPPGSDSATTESTSSPDDASEGESEPTEGDS